MKTIQQYKIHLITIKNILEAKNKIIYLNYKI
jgi:hypothetical protein